MSYTDAIAQVNAGKYAWRAGWPPGWYVHKINTGEIYIYRPTAGVPYAPSSADESALDWDSGDHPPHK